MFRARTAALALLLCAGAACLAAPARASDDDLPPDVDAKALKLAQEAFKRDYDTADIEYKLTAVRRFAAVQHPKVAKDLIRLLREDDEHVRAAAITGLAKQPTSVRTIGTNLIKLIDSSGMDEAHSRAVTAAVMTIGELHIEKATDELRYLVDHPDDGVVSAVFSVWGKWKHEDAIRDMYGFFDRYPDEKSFATGTVKVDTGAAGSADANAAKAKWKSKYGGQSGWRPRPECTKALIAALKEITGYGFRRPEDLKDYLDDPKKYVDPESIADRLDEAQRKELYTAWYRIKEEAKQKAEKDAPGDSAGEQRSKVYRKELYDLRDDILDKHKLRLSDLDVIVEQGDAAGWPK